MKAKIVNGAIEIDLHALIETMSEEEVSSFFEHLVFEEKLLQCFVEMMTDNYVFTDAFHSTTYSSNERTRTLAGKIREKLIPLMPESAQVQMKELIEDADRASKRAGGYFTDLCEIERKYNSLMSDIRSGYVNINGVGYSTSEIKRPQAVVRSGE